MRGQSHDIQSTLCTANTNFRKKIMLKASHHKLNVKKIQNASCDHLLLSVTWVPILNFVISDYLGQNKEYEFYMYWLIFTLLQFLFLFSTVRVSMAEVTLYFLFSCSIQPTVLYKVLWKAFTIWDKRWGGYNCGQKWKGGNWRDRGAL